MQISLRGNRMVRQPFTLLAVCLSIQFFHSPLPLTQSVRPPMATYPHCAAPVLLTGCYATPLVTRCFPPTLSSLTLPWTIARFLDPFYTFSPAHRRVIRDFTPSTLFTVSATDFHFKHVSPRTYLIYLSPKDLYR